MKILQTYFLFCCLLSVSPLFAAVKASVNQTTVFQGDPITLTIQSDQNSDAEPNLIPLRKDFNVSGSQASSQINIINGNRSFKKIWTIELSPKSSGNITIPVISLGDESTEPLEITIKELPSELAAETSKHVFIESSVEIENNETYVQQQIPYTVKLFYDSAMQTGEVLSPQIENANIRALGNDKKYQVVRAGKKYVVVEKRFVISPEKSGVLHIPPTTVKGRIALAGGDSQQLRRRMDETDMLNQFFNNFSKDPFFKSPFDELFSRRSVGPTRPFTVISEAIDVNVMSVPNSFKGTAWLPAEEIIMTDSWSTNPPTLKVGEPVTRKLVLQVKGLASSQIPEIEIPKPTNMKVYPEQAKTETPNDGNTVYGIQQIDISYIPGKEGRVTIPEINVDWWDVKQKEQRTFTLPEWNLSVAAGEILNGTQAAIAPVLDEAPQLSTTITNPLDDMPSDWGWKILALTVIGIFVVIFLIFRFWTRFKRITKSTSRQSKSPTLVDTKALKAALLEASNNNDKHLTAKLLLKFLKAQWNDRSLQNLGLVARRLQAEDALLIKELDRVLYSPQDEQWDGSKLTQLIEKGLHRKPIKQVDKEYDLAPLYPG